MSESETGYVYVLIDPRTEEPKYVGASTDPDQRFKAHNSHPHSDDLDDWISGLQDQGEEPEMEVVVERPVEQLGRAEEAVIAGLSAAHDLLNGNDASGYGRPIGSSPAALEEKDAVETLEDAKQEIERLRQRRDELFDIAWEKEWKLMEIRRSDGRPHEVEDVDIPAAREATRDALEAWDNVDGEAFDEAVDDVGDALGVERDV